MFVRICCTWIVLAGLALADPVPKGLTVIDFRRELGLTEAQIARIKGDLKDLKSRLKACESQRRLLQAEYNQLLKDSAPLPSIKAKLSLISEQTVEAQMADIATARSIRAVLSAQQFSQWQNLQNAK